MELNQQNSNDFQELETVTSVSGGKTSAYMAVHCQSDRYIFAPVLTDDPGTVIKDKGLRDYCKSKVPWLDWDSKGCCELDLTLTNLRELEQILGKEIEWIAAPFTFDQTIIGNIDPVVAKCFSSRATKTMMLPSSRTRFCTQAHKIYPIAWHVWLTGNGNPCIMNIGFRADEMYRVERWTCDKDKLKVPIRCDIEGRFKGKHRHIKLDYRITQFPLVEMGVTKQMVKDYWNKKRLEFPTVSNCDFCMFHHAHHQRHQALNHPERLQWWLDMEDKAKASFGKKKLRTILENDQVELFGDDLDQFQFACACTD
jgi:hypothetical protein